jgi:hypothetical protein
VLAGVAIVSSAFHFWPFEDSKAWQLLCPANLALFLWIAVLVGHVLLQHNRRTITSLLPHVSVFAYLGINVLSAAFAPDPGRALSFTIKLALMLAGGYLLFSAAMSGTKSIRTVFGVTVAAVTVSVSCCLVTRFAFGSENFGFFDNAYKYGTYTGTLAPLCGTYLLMSSKGWKRFVGMLLLIGALMSSGSLGTVAAILVGSVVLLVVVQGWSSKILVVGCLACAIGLLILLDSHPAMVTVKGDVGLADTDGVNLKQRYIEWQAEINLLEERLIAGTGAGCVNEYRSNFYYRLPKLNTLKAFDQNGWLATGAETGIVGLMCFAWVAAHHIRLAYSQVAAGNRPTVHRLAVANFVGLISACTANVFSSVHYNGVLIVFVLVLALVSRTKNAYRGVETCE